MPEHSVITDPNIHEPKGVATATSGQVYVADGAGSGAWSVALPDQTGNSGKFLSTDGTTASWSGDSAVRARGSFTGVTSPVVTGAVNVTSVSRSSAGVYTVNFTSALASTAYQVLIMPSEGSGTDARFFGVGGKSTSSFTIRTRNSSGVYVDTDVVDFVVFGGY